MGLLVSDVMTKRVQKISRKASVEDVRRLLLANENKAILVLENENLLGIVSRTDIIKRYDES
ncbi:CBS domain-containing protein, partial [bacterium]|nr:CBS domain-containing protein [bacterium]